MLMWVGAKDHDCSSEKEAVHLEVAYLLRLASTHEIFGIDFTWVDWILSIELAGQLQRRHAVEHKLSISPDQGIRVVGQEVDGVG